MATNSVNLISLKCAICSGHYSDPLMLPCLHSFCRKCLEQKLDEQRKPNTHDKFVSGRLIKCPICFAISTLPNGEISSISRNLWLAHQVEAAIFQQKLEEMEKPSCQRCVNRDNRSAAVFCCDCHLFICSLCKDDHQCCKETMNHQLVDVCKRKSIDKSVRLFSDATFPRKPVVCSKHDKEELKFFCEDCQCLVCLDCAVIEHSNHKKSYVEGKRKKYLSDLHTSLTKTRNGLHDLENAIATVENLKQQINKHKKEVNEEITKTFREIFAALYYREQQLHARNEEIATAKLTCLDMQLDVFNAHKERMAFATELASRTTDYTATELLSTKKTLQKQLEDTLTSLKQLDMEPAEYNNVYFSIDKAVEQVSKLGRVSGLVDPAQCTVEEGLAIPLGTVGKERNVRVALRDSEGLVVNGNIPVIGKLVNSSKKNSVVLIKAKGSYGNAYLNFVPMEVGEHMLSVTVNKQIISGCPYKIWVRNAMPLNRRSRWLHYYNISGLAVDSNGCVYASNETKHYIQVINANGDLIYKIGSAGTGEGQLRNPCGLALVGEVLYVADSGNNRIQKFTIKGEYLGQFGNGTGRGKLASPRGICSDGKGHILVADYGNFKVQVFTADGTFYRSSPCSSPPCDVAVNNNGMIFVALENEIKMGLNFRSGIETVIHQCVDKQPCGIMVDDNNCIFVVYKNSEVSILNLDEKEISLIPKTVQPRWWHSHLESHAHVYSTTSSNRAIATYAIAIDMQGCVYASNEDGIYKFY